MPTSAGCVRRASFFSLYVISPPRFLVALKAMPECVAHACVGTPRSSRPRRLTIQGGEREFERHSQREGMSLLNSEDRTRKYSITAPQTPTRREGREQVTGAPLRVWTRHSRSGYAHYYTYGQAACAAQVSMRRRPRFPARRTKATTTCLRTPPAHFHFSAPARCGSPVSNPSPTPPACSSRRPPS